MKILLQNSNKIKFFYKKYVYFLFQSDKFFFILVAKQVLLKKKEESLFILTKDFTFSKILTNLLKGFLIGYKRTLEIRGIGFKFDIKDNALQIDAGFSHKIKFKQPSGVIFNLKKNKLKISGNELNLITQTASRVKLFKKTDIYKGKGIFYLGEALKLKEGKKKKK